MEKNKELRVFAEEIRVETLKELANLGFGHIGGSLSIADALAVLYGGIMKFDPKDPAMEDRDKVVVSKHVGTDVTLDKVDYKFVKQDEILAVVE